MRIPQYPDTLGGSISSRDYLLKTAPPEDRSCIERQTVCALNTLRHATKRIVANLAGKQAVQMAFSYFSTSFLLIPFSLFLLPFSVFLIPPLHSAQEVTNDMKKIFIEEQLRLADGLCQRGHYQMAVDEYRKIIGKFPDDPLAADAFSQLAEAYSSSGDFEKAIENYKIFFSKFPAVKTVPAVRINYSIALSRTGDEENVKEAVSVLREVKNTKEASIPVKYAAGYHLGKILLGAGDLKNAKSEFSELASVNINSKDDLYAAFARLELAGILDRENKREDAEKLIRSLIDNSNTPQEILCAAINYLGNLNFERKQYLQAADNYEQLWLISPSSTAGKEAYYRRLECLFLAREYPRLIKELDKEIEKSGAPDARSEKLYFIKASALMEQNQYPEAIRTFSEISSSTKSTPEYFSKSALQTLQCLISQTRITEAVKTAMDFITSRRIPTETKISICSLVIPVLKAPHEKTSFMKDTIATARDVTERYTLKLSLAELYSSLAQVDSALALYKDILAECPEEIKPACLMGIAKAYETSRQDKEALDYYQKVRVKYPGTRQYPEAILRTAVLLLYDKPDSNEPRDLLLKLENDYRAEKEIHGSAVFYLSYIDFIRGNFSGASEGFRKIAYSDAYEAGLVMLGRQYLLWSIMSEKATPESDRLFTDFSSSESRFLSVNPDLLLFIGNKFSETGRLDDSIRCFQTAAKNSSPDYRLKALTGLGTAYEKKGDLEKAVRFFREGEKIQTPNKDLYSELLSLLGASLVKKGEKNEAVLVFEKCIDISGSKTASARARLGLAGILSENPEDLARANRYAMSVFILSDDPVLSQQAMLLSIDLSLRKKNLEEARATFDELKKRFPELLKTDKVKKMSEKMR
ncbi:MAG: tetratricopeptide repeat protein [Victivallales bacterium]